MAKKTTKRRAWTKENVRTLKVFAQKKKRAASIAETLKRTEGAIRQKACSLGLSLDTRCRKFASPRPASDKNFCLYCGRRDGDGRQFLAIKAEQILSKSIRARYRMVTDTRFNLFNALALPQPPMSRLKRHGTIGVRSAPA